jgi:GTP cyclohydrolase II
MENYYRYSETNLPTRFGNLKMIVYRNSVNDIETIAMVAGEVEGQENVPVRMHSECMTSEVFGSLKCDCKDQLDYALEYISQQQSGIVIYLRQEGRGIGLGNKIKAYALQEQGFDTVEANTHLGFDDDLRDYDAAIAILKELGVASIELFTNNPKKLESLQDAGIKIKKRRAIEMEPNKYSGPYLLTKVNKSGHLIDRIHLKNYVA